jgi:hypothetical protein
MGTLRKLPTPVQDPVLGTVTWDPDEDAWVVHGQVAPFRILLAGEAGPDPRLLEHARDLCSAPEKVAADVASMLGAAAEALPVAKHEILGLRIESICLMWPDRPEDGMIYFDGPDTAERIWRCDYIARCPQGLGFDD